MYYDLYEVFEDKEFSNQWRCESVGDDGDVLIAIFIGTDAEARAREYARFQNQE